MASDLGFEPDGIEAVLAAWNTRRPAYLRARRLADGPDITPRSIVEALVVDAEAALDAPSLDALPAWALAARRRVEIVALNAAGLMALHQSDFGTAAALAAEANARDHHDLYAQRLSDAAAAQTAALEGEVDAWLADRFCAAPFQQIETRANGAVHFCCSAWQPAPIGTITEGSNAFWNSASAREIRRSIHDGDFSHCSRWHCPMIAARRLPRREEAMRHSDRAIAADVRERRLEVEASPARVILSHDRSCNLSCPSCRDRLIQIDHSETRALDQIFEGSLLKLVAGARSIKVTGSGDPFGSRHFRSVLRRLTAAGPPQRRLQLHTNGQLCNERAWNELGLWGHVDKVWVSVDAAEPATYSELRRGGTFETLLENLAFLGRVRKADGFNWFRLDFVVQRRNYTEMGDFVDLARRVGADAVYFLRLRNWGHTAPDEFRAMDICDPVHVEHERFRRHLADPRLASPSVEQGSLATLIWAAQADRGAEEALA